MNNYMANYTIARLRRLASPRINVLTSKTYNAH